MSIKIHHGPNGSYKTSGAIQDDAIPALKAGRLVITNVRGFTLERVLQVYPDIPDTADIINLDLESMSDMDRMRSWFQWAPRGAFIIFDETQLVFPKAWREKDLEKFDFPGGSEAASVADRPFCWLDGWTRHRHWNWDIVLTTPNIAYIRDDIRMTCEMAYKHSNLAVIGISGRYKEAQHDAQVNRPPVEGTIIEYKKIKPETFLTYQSTATGVTQDTKAGKNLLRSPKLLFLLVFIAFLFISLFSLGSVDFVPVATNQNSSDRIETVSDSASSIPKVPSVEVSTVRSPSLAGKQTVVSSTNSAHPLAPRSFELLGFIKSEREGRSVFFGRLAVINDDGSSFEQTFDDLKSLGYQVFVRNSCYVQIIHPLGFNSSAVCAGKLPDEKTPGQRAAQRLGSERSGEQAGGVAVKTIGSGNPGLIW